MTPVSLPEEIQGPRITLRKHALSQAASMFQYVDQDRERLGQFLPWVKFTKGIDDERDYIEMTHNQWDERRMFDYGIFRKEGNLYMGNIGVHTISWDNLRCELGYWILGGFEGQGYVSEAVQTLENVLFKTGFYRIEIQCSGLNKKSSAVAERCGYKFEARLREHAVENGLRRDTLIYAKLLHER